MVLLVGRYVHTRLLLHVHGARVDTAPRPAVRPIGEDSPELWESLLYRLCNHEHNTLLFGEIAKASWESGLENY